MTSKSYIDLDKFVMEKLPRNIELARQYEKVANYWHFIGQQAQNLVRDSNEIIDYKLWEDEIEKALEIISKASLDKDHKNKSKIIKSYYYTYKNDFDSLILLVNNRSGLIKQNRLNRKEASKRMQTEIEALMKDIKDTISDLQKSVKSSDFQNSLSGTSLLLDKIKRIESDLVISEKEISLYLNTNQSFFPWFK